MWVTGLFFWVDAVQSNPVYSENLDRIADGNIGYEDFIDSVSDEILGSSEDDKMERQSNFMMAVSALGLLSRNV